MYRVFIVTLFLFLFTSPDAFSSVKILASDKGEEHNIYLGYKDSLKSAIFLRGNRLWIILDQKVQGDTLPRNSFIRDFGQVENSQNSSISYLDLNDVYKYEFTASQTHDSLRINIKPYDNSILPSEVPVGRTINKEFSSHSGNKLVIPTESDELVSFSDPLIGDTIFAVLEKIPQRNVKNTFVDCKILDSLSGIVIQKMNDSLEVTLQNNNVEISSSSHLNISDYESSENRKFSFLHSGNAIVDLRSYSVAPHNFAKNLSAIEQEISQITDRNMKANAYIRLGVFLLANQWYSEAKAVFDVAYRLNPIVAQDYHVRLLTGISYFMCGSLDESNEVIQAIDISAVPIKHRPEIRFWQKLLKVELENDKRGVNNSETNAFIIQSLGKKLLNSNQNFLSSYNSSIFNFVFFKILSISDKIDDKHLVEKIVKTVSLSDMKNNEKRLLQYYKGLSSQSEKAISLFNECSNEVTDRYTYAHCRFALLNLLFEKKVINSTEYINGLQGVSTIWRGDTFEVDVLNKIASTYYEIGDVTDAMRVWVMISKIYKGSYIGLQGSGRATEALVKYFKQNNTSELEQLSFFYEFKDLIPLGPEGDSIIMQTAANMVNLDLLAQASKVMEYQIRHRLIGIDRERIINELVRVYNDMKEYGMSAKTVNGFTKFPMNKNNPLVAKRSYLYAKALSGNDDPEKGIAVLADDKSFEADQIRSEIFFKTRDWDGFNDSSEPYIYFILHQDKQLQNGDSKKLLEQSIAYFSNNQLQNLQNLYLDFKPKLKKNDKYAEQQQILYKIASELKSEDFTATKESNEYLKKLIRQVSTL